MPFAPKLLLTALLATLLSSPLVAQTESEASGTSLTFPMLEADDLNGREVTLPSDFPGDPTLVFVAFKQRQQEAVNEWVAALDLESKPDVPWVELPTINKGFRIMKGFVDNGMRSGITATNARARTISIYGQASLMEPLGIERTDEIWTLVVRPDGEVLAMEVGAPSSEKILTIGSAMGVSFPAL